MRFCATVGVPEKSVFTRLFKVFATAVLANFQDRLVVTASIPLRIVKKCVAVFVRLAKWFCFAAFGRQPEMRLRNLYGIMPAACGLPACGTAFDLPFQYSKRGAICQDSRGHKNRKPRHAAAFGRKSIR